MNAKANLLTTLPPGSAIGILGGGQLGRMMALAAARLGYLCHIYCPDPDAPAFQVSERHTIAAYDDLEALNAFAATVDVITYEFENIGLAGVQHLATLKPVYPDPKALEIGQHRLSEKQFFENIGAAVPPWQAIRSADDLVSALKDIQPPAVLKTTRMGYDGKGQIKLTPGSDPIAAWGALRADEAILESFVDFVAEVSVVVARGKDADGHIKATAFDMGENIHKNHILHSTTVPAPCAFDDELEDLDIPERALEIAEKAAEALDIIGVMAVEMFVTADGRLLVNEMAPRVHNSGHFTQDACITDQFEQHVRAICGLPLGSPARTSNVRMINLIGDDVEALHGWLSMPDSCLHLYGKAEVRAGRKMGHVNRLYPLADMPPE